MRRIRPAAQQLARAGHAVTVFEKNDRVGGLLRYGIPDFKLEKAVIDRRLEQMAAEGVVFKTGVAVGKDISPEELKESHDALVLCLGATWPRDLNVEGRSLTGIHFAMEFLQTWQQKQHGDDIDHLPLSAKVQNGFCFLWGILSVFQLPVFFITIHFCNKLTLMHLPEMLKHSFKSGGLASSNLRNETCK